LKTRLDSRPLITAGFVLGVGMGAFVDGILCHQILQIHQMLSNIMFPDTLVKVDINMFWDGLFDAFAWTMTLIGIVLLWKAAKNVNVPNLTQVLVGAMLTGMGAFNLIEGVIDHHILQLHHVVQRAASPAQLYWDLAFLASGIVLLCAGSYVIRRSLKSEAYAQHPGNC
jgi:uncharacterized membrane protein